MIEQLGGHVVASQGQAHAWKLSEQKGMYKCAISVYISLTAEQQELVAFPHFPWVSMLFEWQHFPGVPLLLGDFLYGLLLLVRWHLCKSARRAL